MDIFLALIISASVLVILLTIWLLRWLKQNYPQSYNDPAMVGLGGFAAFIMIGSQKLSILPEPYELLAATIPIYIAISFMSAGKLHTKLSYSSLSLAVVAITAAATYFCSLGSWVAHSTVVVVFSTLWVILFRWRYVHNQNN
ncbi:hypothetical protein [Microbulbifer sp. ZKSA002]|uniref:hypothetical protein n=1 Tax=Microbulbifer sp. ZKSA002 TaxID=3243388 RepID=UPI0040398720